MNLGREIEKETKHKKEGLLKKERQTINQIQTIVRFDLDYLINYKALNTI